MARLNREDGLVNARIVYWGVEGAGKTANLQAVHDNLRADLRGEIETVPTRIDPSVDYEVLPIELGEIAGLRTRIQMISVPGGAGHGPTRKQLLDQVDGIVFVVDSQGHRTEENASSLMELRALLDEYGRALDDVPLVVQYNKRDLTDPFALESLHRRLDVPGAAAFEAVATEATGVMQTLSTLSKGVIRTLRGQQFDVQSGDNVAERNSERERAQPATQPLAPAVEASPGAASEDTFEGPAPESPFSPDPDDSWPDADASPTVLDSPRMETADPLDADPVDPIDPVATSDPIANLEDAILAEADHPDVEAIDGIADHAQSILDAPWEEVSAEAEHGDDELRLGPELSIHSVGEATRSGERGIRVPVVLRDKGGRTGTLVLTIQLDPWIEDD